MGSRTGASYTSIVGKNRRIHKDIAILSTPFSTITMQSGTSFAAQSASYFSMQSGTSVSVQSDTSLSMQPGTSLVASSNTFFPTQSDTPLSKEECEARAKIAMGFLINSNPVLAIAYHALSIAEKIITLYPEIEDAYQRGGDEAVIQLLVEKALKIGINMGINMIVSEVADQSWTLLKTETGIDTTPNQDQVAKLVINKVLKTAIDAAKEGRTLDGEFVYKQVYSAIFDYFSNSLMESKSESSDQSKNRSPYYFVSTRNLNDQMLLREVVKKLTMEIAEELFERTKDGRRPHPVTMRKRLIEIMNERYSFEMTDEDPYEQTRKSSSKNIIETDEKSVRNTRNSIILSTMSEVNNHQVSKKNQIRLSFKNIKRNLSPEEKDLANFAAFLFEMETLIRKKSRAGESNVLPKKVTFTVHSETDGETKNLMENIFAFLLEYHPKFQINEKIESGMDETTHGQTVEKIEAVCLYSGGLDSTIGYFGAKTKFNNFKLVFVDHEIHKIAGYVNKLAKELNFEKDLLKATSFSGGSDFLQQTRGFMYLTAAAIYANHLGSDRVIISECGVTKYQPNISIADEITKTTHPYMLKLAAALFKKKGINVAISMPFDDLTKAEMVSLYSDQIDLLKTTYSCRGGFRIASDNKVECGYCMSCLIKNIALTYVTGQKQEQFVLDPLTHKCSYFVENSGKHTGLNYSKLETVMRLIDFTSSVLRSDGSIHQATLDSIEDYNKLDLFRRYSEDTIYGLSFMKLNNMLQNEEVLAKLSSIENEPWFNAKRISGRREELLKQNKKPIW